MARLYPQLRKEAPDGMTADEAREILEHKERRDRFAMAALNGLLRDGVSLEYEDAAIARQAYQIADAMIKARDA